MAAFVDIERVRSAALCGIGELVEIVKLAETYAATPTEDNAEALVEAVEKHASQHEGFKLNVATMIKQASGVDDEIAAVQTENGILLR